MPTHTVMYDYRVQAIDSNDVAGDWSDCEECDNPQSWRRILSRAVNYRRFGGQLQ